MVFSPQIRCTAVFFFLKKGQKKKEKNKSQSLLWRWNTPLGSQVHSVFFPHWMHKYNKALHSGLGCGSALWRNEGDWRCMCPGIGTGRDPSSTNYPSFQTPMRNIFSKHIYAAVLTPMGAVRTQPITCHFLLGVISVSNVMPPGIIWKNKPGGK